MLSDDYYQLLGVNKNALSKDIRKAFKQLALKLHPDKNNEKEAHAKFLKVNEAYEVLKDEQLRKKYDLLGANGIDNTKPRSKYESWNYFHDDFAIYDDDEEVYIIDSISFKKTVLDSHDLWFINFYSPRCRDCHDLAPIWRKVAKELEGIVRIGAVNCQEEFIICTKQGIANYPTLHLYNYQEERKIFNGHKTEEDIIAFILSLLPDLMVDLWVGNFEKIIRSQEDLKRAWLVLFCDKEEMCINHKERRLLGAALDGLARLGRVDCNLDKEICDKLRGHHQGAKILFLPLGLQNSNLQTITSSFNEARKIADEVFNHLPEIPTLDTRAYEVMLKGLNEHVSAKCLIYFVLGTDGESSDHRKLPFLLPNIKVRRLDCRKETMLCSRLRIGIFPSFAFYKTGGSFETHYGTPGVKEVVLFATLADQAPNMRTLMPSDFPDITRGENPVFIFFFAPWCGPCMRLLPEFRRASTLTKEQRVIFGTIDCSIHPRFCSQLQVRQYPSLVLYNRDRKHYYHGRYQHQDIADFVINTVFHDDITEEISGEENGDDEYEANEKNNKEARGRRDEL